MREGGGEGRAGGRVSHECSLHVSLFPASLGPTGGQASEGATQRWGGGGVMVLGRVDFHSSSAVTKQGHDDESKCFFRVLFFSSKLLYN